MRLIERSTLFKKDFKREYKGRYKKTIELELTEIIYKLASNVSLEPKYKNHPLSGDWNGYWECHIKPDLLLIYKKIEPNSMLLARIGSHSELFR